MNFFYIYFGYLLWLSLICASASMAIERGRNDSLWGSIAFLLTPIVAIGLLWFLGETEEVKRKRIWQEKVNKILEKQREELRRDWIELNAYKNR